MFPRINPTSTKSWRELKTHFQANKHLLDKKDKAVFTKDLGARFKVDYQYGLWNEVTLGLLVDLAHECKLGSAIKALFSGEKINETENRAVLHTALRDYSSTPLYVNGVDIKPIIQSEREKIKAFTEKLHAGKIKGSTGKRINTIVNIGIGGSAIGPRMVVKALEKYRHPEIQVHYISSIDADPIAALLQQLDLERTLFLVVSKTFTTLETMTNAELIKREVIEQLGDSAWEHHVIGVTANPEKAISFGVPKENIFLFWDWVCGRFSLWGSVGLSIALAIGYENFENLLKGAEETDIHFKTQDFKENIPVLHALLGIWYTNFHGSQTSAIIPYNHALRELKLYLQQAAMESNGKSVDRNGEAVAYATCPVIWGEVGNDAQHSFFQLLHQGTHPIPADFIVVKDATHPYTTSHQHLLANYYAQVEALVAGRDKEATQSYLNAQGIAMSDDELLHRVFPGKKPVTPLYLQELTPKSLGSLLAMYEHTYFVQGVIWNVYSFDQWGVELGKTLASTNKIKQID